MEEYCYAHRQLIRRGRPIPVPSRRCDIGTQSGTRLCKGCGQITANRLLLRIEAQAQMQYSIVIGELRAGNISFEEMWNLRHIH